MFVAVVRQASGSQLQAPALPGRNNTDIDRCASRAHMECTAAAGTSVDSNGVRAATTLPGLWRCGMSPWVFLAHGMAYFYVEVHWNSQLSSPASNCDARASPEEAAPTWHKTREST